VTAVTDFVTEPASLREAIVAERPRAVRRSGRLEAYLRARLPLLAVMVVISVLAVRLMLSNTAFADEALYLSAGHVIWHHWMTGAPSSTYADYFSGAPTIYPVLANAANAIGGLVAARVLSLIFMLVTVCVLDATTRRLFNARAAGWAVVVFATVQGAQFLAAFATYDAMALMLLTLSLWVSVRFIDQGRRMPHAGLLIGAPIMALANATKYASALYDPVVIAVIGLLIAREYGWQQSRRCVAMFTAIVILLVATGIAFGGQIYVHGINLTTLERGNGTSSVASVLHGAWDWVGALTVLSAVAVVVAVIRFWRGERSVADRSNLALVAVLAFAVTLAPIEQARINTITSLHKHVAFGAWFAAIAAGALLAGVSGRRLVTVWRWLPPLTLLFVLGVVGRAQAQSLYRGWPDSRSLISTLKPYVDDTTKPVLMDDSDIGKYYLQGDIAPSRWSGTYFLQEELPGQHKSLFGLPAYRYAIAHDIFGVVALNFGVQRYTDLTISGAISHNPRYHYVGEVDGHDSYGSDTFRVWVYSPPASVQ
jgi:Dolichyl-phosphate-mannose-protein mannosyltransferase